MSADGKILMISSRDAYCSMISFDDGELGTPIQKQQEEPCNNVAQQETVSDAPTSGEPMETE